MIKRIFGALISQNNGTISTPSTTTIEFTTNSTDAAWTPTSITNTGDTLVWSASGGGITPQEFTSNSPTFDFSSNTGIVTVIISSTDNFAGLTVFKLASKGITSIILGNATSIDTLFLYSNQITTIDLSTNVDISRLWLQGGNPITSLDLTNNTLLDEINLADADISQSDMDAIFNQLDTNGLSNGTLTVAGNNGISTASYDAYNNLVAKGWTIDIEAPSVPDTENPVIGTLSYANETASTVELSCTATDNVAVVSFDIYKDSVFLKNVTGASLSSEVITGLSSSTNYNFYVVARDTAGNISSNSNTINFTTSSSADTENPTAPTLTVGTITSSSIQLNWSGATDNIGVVSYNIFKDSVFLKNTTNSSSDIITGLDPSTNYDFYVTALDLAGNESVASNTVSPTTSAASTGTTPVLYNFRIENSNTNRVYFDSSVGITGSTYTGFSITGKTISGIYVNSSNLTGHYFTVSSPFDFWDNNTIAYSGGSDIGIHPIDREYIYNNISEPVSTTIRYVSPSGGGSHDGTSEANAWTFTEALNNDLAGMTIYMKAGNYGSSSYTISTSGTSTNPIKWIGYQTSPGDNPILGFDKYTNNTADSSKMPLFYNPSGSGTGITISADNIIIRNIQVDYYSTEFRLSGGRTNVILDNVYALRSAASNYGIIADSDACSKCRIINSYAQDAGTCIIRWYGTHMLIANTDVSQPAGRTNGVDYYIVIRGNNNIVRNCELEHMVDLGHTGHGMCVKSVGVQTENGLYENLNIIGIKGAVEARHHEVAFNVFKNITCTEGNVSIDNTGGVHIMSGSHDNIYNNVHVQNGDSMLRVWASSEDTAAPSAGYNNIFKNCNSLGNKYGLFFYSDSYADRQFYNNYFINCNIYGSTVRSLNTTSLNMGTNYFINGNVVENPSNEDAPNMVYSYSNFYNSGTVPSGTSIISINPQFNDPTNGNFHLTGSTPTSVSEGGQTRSEVNYDGDGNERTAPYSIGAYNKV